MRKLSLFLALAFAVAAIMPLIAVSQTSDQKSGVMPPPNIISIEREEIKHGKAFAHEKNETAWTQALIRAKYPNTFLGLESLTGPSEVMWLWGFPSFAAYEADYKMQNSMPAIQSVAMQYGPAEADDVSNESEMVARYRADLSYGDPINIGVYRYFSIATTRVRLGHNADYEEFMKTLNEARKSANNPVHVAVYQVTSGAQAGTFISFTPRKSLAEMDATNQAMTQAMADVQQKINELVEKSVTTTSNAIFAINPRMSKPTDAMAAADPAFWKPKVTMAKAAAPADAKATAKKENKP